MSLNVMDKVVKLNSQTAGRDRVFRLLQYGSRIVWAYLEKYSNDKDVINKLKNLEYSLSTARKLLRLGRGIEHLYFALNNINLHDTTLRLTLTLSKINMALFLMADNILWFGRVGLVNVDKTKWSQLSYRLWLYYLIMNLTRDIYEIMQVTNCSINGHFSVLKKGMQSCGGNSKFNFFLTFIQKHKDITLDTIKNGCDVWIPLSLLGYVSLSPAFVGFLGVISSIAGMIPLIDHTCKLTPG